MKKVNSVVTLVVLVFVIFCFFYLKGFPPYDKKGNKNSGSEPPKNAGMLDTPR